MAATFPQLLISVGQMILVGFACFARVGRPACNDYGDADVLSGSSCTPQKAAVKGQIDGRRMGVTLVLPDGQASREFVFTRRSYGSGADD